jgi:histidinol-phosphatase (PHP family)
MISAKSDMHVHTDDSPDANIPAWQLVRLAIEKELSVLGFVAHLDLNPEDYCYGGFNAASYSDSISRALSESGGKISIRKGLEIGEPHKYQHHTKNLLDYSDYDFITGSLHSVEGIGMVLGAEVFKNRNPLEIVENYYLETLRMVTDSDIDILAHMGLFRRGLALAGLESSFDETELWPETVRRILCTIIERDIALELNTSGLRRKENTTYPTTEILRMYFELGGALLTIGSDTHREPYLFYGLDEGMSIIREIGFTAVYTFRNRIHEVILPG